MDTLVIGAALAEHFGHRDWTLIGADKVQLDESDDVIEISTLEIEALLSQWGNTKATLDCRAKRNALLVASDWTQVADAPVDQAEWAVYRQALRDVTDQSGFPENVVWPVKP
jgi:hypothetical protein